MDSQECKNCGQRNNCEKVYDQLCNSKGPSILRNTIEVLLIPLVLFIVAIITAERMFFTSVSNEPLRILCTITTAIIVVGLYIVVLKKWRYKN